jgi:hypothetical protein
LMTLLEVTFWRAWKIVGVLEWHENQFIWNRLTRRPSSTMSYSGVFLLHFLNGGLAAIPFPLIVDLLPVIGWAPLALTGAAYGSALWFLTLVLIHEPITGVSITRHPLGEGPVTASLFGHLLYGVSLGLLIRLI